jgi:hypothetical protein
MSTQKRRHIADIVAASRPEVKAKLAERVLVECIMGREVDCLSLLRESAIATILTSCSDNEVKSATALLRQHGFGNADEALIEAAMLFTPRMRLRLAEFSMVGHLVVRGPRPLLEATAVACALRTKVPEEYNAAFRALAILSSDDSSASKLFQNLVRTRYLEMKDLDAFVQLRLAVARLREKQRLIAEGVEHIVIESFPPILTYCEKADGCTPYREYHADIDGKTYTMDGNRSIKKSGSIAQWSSVGDSHLVELTCLLLRGGIIEHYDDLVQLDSGLHQVLDERSLVGKVRFKTRASEPAMQVAPDSSVSIDEAPNSRKRKERWSERPRIPVALLADQLRAFQLAGVQISEYQMYQLICLHCFHMAGGKAMIGEAYGPITSLKSNLLEALHGDREQTRLFYRCWDKMAVRGAIRLKKNGTVASLNPHTQDITDQNILPAVAWAFSEHRRLLGESVLYS